MEVAGVGRGGLVVGMPVVWPLAAFGGYKNLMVLAPVVAES